MKNDYVLYPKAFPTKMAISKFFKVKTLIILDSSFEK